MGEGSRMSTLLFIVEILLIVAAIVAVSYLIEKSAAKRNGTSLTVITTRKTAMVGVFAAAAGILMLLEIPLPFAPPFYKLDISEVPVLILTFAYGPVAGILTEMLKIFIKLLIKGTTSAFVGELANFVIGASLILPAGLIYFIKKTKKQALLACIAGTLVMTVFGSLFNGIYLLPKFAEIYGMPLDAIIGMGTAINPNISSVSGLVLMCVVPMNLIKGAIDSLITNLIYKRLSPIIKK